MYAQSLFGLKMVVFRRIEKVMLNNKSYTGKLHSNENDSSRFESNSIIYRSNSGLGSINKQIIPTLNKKTSDACYSSRLFASTRRNITLWALRGGASVVGILAAYVTLLVVQR